MRDRCFIDDNRSSEGVWSQVVLAQQTLKLIPGLLFASGVVAKSDIEIRLAERGPGQAEANQ